MRRKLAQAQSTAVSCKKESEKLQWTVKEKEMIIGKIQAQLSEVREEINNKSFSYQKEVKTLQEKCKKYKEEIEKQKSRLEFTEREYNEAFTAKTTKTFQKLKEVTLMEEEEARMKQSHANLTEEEEEDRMSRKKRTLHTLKSSSTKYFLPTLTKINKEESYLKSKTEFDEEQVEDLSKTTKTEILKNTQDHIK